MNPAITLADFEVRAGIAPGSPTLLQPVTLELAAGGLYLLVASGEENASTLLSALLGITDERRRWGRQGEVSLLGVAQNGAFPSILRGRVGVVFRGGSLIGEFSALENLRLIARQQGLPFRQVRDTLIKVGLPNLPRTVAELSSQERFRLALASALLSEPDLLCLEEPTAGLEPAAALAVAKLIDHVHSLGAPRRTTLVLTSDPEVFANANIRYDRLLHFDAARATLALHGREESWRFFPGFSEQLKSSEAAAEAVGENGAGASNGVSAGTAEATQPRSRTSAALQNIATVATLLVVSLFVALRNILPRHLGVLARTAVDQIVAPAPFVAGSAFLGGLMAALVAHSPAVTAAAGSPAASGPTLAALGTALVYFILPALAGLLLAVRITATSTARLETLVRERVFDSLPLAGLSPVALFLNPLFLSAIAAGIVLTALAIVSGLFAAFMIAQFSPGSTNAAWGAATFSQLSPTGFLWVLGKAVASGSIAALTSYSVALASRSAGSPPAGGTGRAMLLSAFLILAVHAFMTLLQLR